MYACYKINMFKPTCVNAEVLDFGSSLFTVRVNCEEDTGSYIWVIPAYVSLMYVRHGVDLSC